MRKKIILLLEVFIWILLLGGLVFLGIKTIKYKLASHPIYQVVFKDVDSLMIGAPVRIMGIDVGHVSEIKPVDDEVYVSFIIKDSNVFIPDGSVISIQFTGLAGSKSLEIKPPKGNSSGSSLKIAEPVRINSLMEMQTQISKSTLDSLQNVLKMFGKGGVDSVKSDIKTVSKNSQDLITNAKRAKETIEYANISILDRSKYLKDVLSSQNTNMNNIYSVYFNNNSNDEIKNYVNSFANSINEQSNSLENKKAYFKNNIKSDVKGFKTNANNFKSLINETGNKTFKSENNGHQTSDDVFNNFKQMLNFVNDIFKSDNIKRMSNESEKFKNTTEDINKSI